MSDLVERLRAGSEEYVCDYDDLRLAADEIERLRAGLRQIAKVEQPRDEMYCHHVEIARRLLGEEK